MTVLVIPVAYGHTQVVDSVTDSSLTNSDPGSDPLINTVLDDTYEIRTRIGKGGMGSVYKAFHRHLDKIVAVKVIRTGHSGSTSAVQRFRQEARALSLLSHPNIVHSHSFGTHRDIWYLAMDFVDGATLREEVELHGPLSNERFKTVFRQVLQALDHAHAHQVLHRDLKPDNIMLMHAADGTDLVKLVDFGIAKVQSAQVAQQHLTQTGTFLGSPLYASPEQCSGKAPDARSDIYALGCVMHFSLTGHPPFADDNIVALMQKHVAQPAPSLPGSIEPRIKNAISVALSKSPDERFASAAEFETALSDESSNRIAVRTSVHTDKSKPTFIQGLKQRTWIYGALTVAIVITGVFFSWPLWGEPELLRQSASRSLDAYNEVSGENMAERMKHRENEFWKPQLPVMQTISKPMDEMIAARTKLAQWFLNRGEIDHAAEIAEELRAQYQQCFQQNGSLPLLGTNTISGITTLGNGFKKASDLYSAALCTTLAINSYQANMTFSESKPAEFQRQLDDLEQTIPLLKGQEIQTRKLIGRTGVRSGAELHDECTAYMFAAEYSGRFSSAEQTDRLVSKAIQSSNAIPSRGSADVRRRAAEELFNGGLRLRELEKLPEASAFFERAAEIAFLDAPSPDPLSPAAAYHAALCLHSAQPKSSRPLEFLARAANAANRLDRSRVPFLIEMGQMQLDLGRVKESKTTLSQALKEPTFRPECRDVPQTEAFMALPKLANISLIEGDKIAAVNALDQFISKSPNKIAHLCEAGTIFLTNHEPVEASRSFQLAYEKALAEGDAVLVDTAAAGLNQASAMRGDLKSAIYWAKIAAAHAEQSKLPSSKQALRTYELGIALFQDGRYKDAIPTCNHAIELCQHSPLSPKYLGIEIGANFHLGCCYYRLNKFKESRAALLRSIKLIGNRPRFTKMKQSSERVLSFMSGRRTPDTGSSSGIDAGSGHN